MSSTSAPFGLRPAYHPSGLDRAVTLAGGIASGYASNILKGQPIKMNTAGWIEIVTGGGAFLGAFAGVEWTDATGRRRVSNYWPANESFQVGSVIAYYYSDPNIVYEVQAAGSLTQAAVGDEFDLSNETAGSTTTGLSACTLSTSAAGSGQLAQMRVINLAPYPDNAWGDSYTIVQATIAEYQFAGAAGTAV